MTLFELLELLRKRIKLVIALPLVCAICVAVWSRFLPNRYTTSTTMYVLTLNEESKDAVTQQDLSLGSMLTTDVSTILQSRRVKNDVAQQLGLKSLAGYSLSVDDSSTSRVIKLSVTGYEPEMVTQVANALVADTSVVASEIMNIESVNVIDEATVPLGPSGPPRRRYVAVGFMAGLFAAVCLVVVEDMLDTRVRNGEEAEDIVRMLGEKIPGCKIETGYIGPIIGASIGADAIGVFAYGKSIERFSA
jgi:capsular polysaccharide biosynthesis protein